MSLPEDREEEDGKINPPSRVAGQVSRRAAMMGSRRSGCASRQGHAVQVWVGCRHFSLYGERLSGDLGAGAKGELAACSGAGDPRARGARVRGGVGEPGLSGVEGGGDLPGADRGSMDGGDGARARAGGPGDGCARGHEAGGRSPHTLGEPEGRSQGLRKGSGGGTCGEHPRGALGPGASKRAWTRPRIGNSSAHSRPRSWWRRRSRAPARPTSGVARASGSTCCTLSTRPDAPRPCARAAETAATPPGVPSRHSLSRARLHRPPPSLEQCVKAERQFGPEDRRSR